MTDSGHTLTTSDQLAFLARHPVIALRVSMFQQIADSVGYDQAPNPPGGYDFTNYDILDYWLRQLPGWIPSWGLDVPDSIYPHVIIFPDAVGNLRYTGVDSAPGDINLPYPVPLPDKSPLDQVKDWAVNFAIGYVALEVWKAVKK